MKPETNNTIRTASVSDLRSSLSVKATGKGASCITTAVKHAQNTDNGSATQESGRE